MKKDRRDFLKLAGCAAVAGVGSSTAFHSLLRGEAEAAGLKRAGTKKDKSGTRLGMVIDIQKFIDNRDLAQRCIRVCHQIHNVPDFGNPKDEIKWLWTDRFEHVFVKDTHYRQAQHLQGMPVLSLCNHCDNPPCVRACPTKATFKKDDGVVGMDYHRCIGCRFCMAACPYGARSFNWRDPRGMDEHGRSFISEINPEYPARTMGVVEKCNFCTERLAVGKIPACVEEAAAAEAMFFGDLNDPDSEVSRVLREKFTIQRRPSLGTYPSVFYII
ncbi:sulfate reduction electron transfer complex DsrMKJOP subunit DsrO [Desulfurivibrio dismutans]|uniref:sulfate reduction electron transfer complex DsrMKJOP subunit DsrO n=1 Tax=Desulfurivibrio dismutans TaxID=1398908 RepID=UPI0023D9DC49|nr:4Fe-4S dicluster domain-containing protein [Desulfurivibrio alkaliphilus]MDF1615716.1 4Fe-4S dicluster domain-containing protein [Desulfurivibrio alkaliphilus]